MKPRTRAIGATAIGAAVACLNACVVPKLTFDPDAGSGDTASGGSDMGGESGSGGNADGGADPGGTGGEAMTPEAPEPLTGALDVEAGFNHTLRHP